MKHLQIACLALLSAPSAMAQSQALLDTRDATLYLAYGGGFATAGKNGTVGSLDPVGLGGPATLVGQGADSFTGGYLGWAVCWQMAWDLQQTWGLSADGHTVSGSGYTQLAQSSSVIGQGCLPSCPASVLMTARNWQDFQFTLDAPTAYQFHSEVSLDEGVQINRWDESRQRWFTFASGVAGGVADRSGTLDAGRWQVVNSRGADVLGSTPASLSETWTFTLTLANAQWVSAVPEPTPALLLPVGLVALAGLRRRASGGQRA